MSDPNSTSLRDAARLRETSTDPLIASLDEIVPIGIAEDDEPILRLPANAKAEPKPDAPKREPSNLQLLQEVWSNRATILAEARRLLREGPKATMAADRSTKITVLAVITVYLAILALAGSYVMSKPTPAPDLSRAFKVPSVPALSIPTLPPAAPPNK